MPAHPPPVSHLTLFYFLAYHWWLPEFILYGDSFFYYLSSPLESKFPVGRDLIYLVYHCTWLPWTCPAHRRCSNICWMLYAKWTKKSEKAPKRRWPLSWGMKCTYVHFFAGIATTTTINAFGESLLLPSTIFFLNFLYWNIFDLQCCVSFRCTAKWFSYTYHISTFSDSFPI